MRTVKSWRAAAVLMMIPAAILACGGTRAGAEEKSPEMAAYLVQWDSPSEDYHGSMPLGNGEVGANVWVDPAGDVNFFISRADCFDEYGRLVKIGGGKIVIRTAPDENAAEIADFSQTLDVRMGMLHVRYTRDSRPVHVLMLVDAHHPMVTVRVYAPESLSAEFQTQCWRTEPGEVVEAREASDLLQPWRTEMRTRPDVMLDAAQAGEHCVGWYHHNAESFGYEENAKIQGMDDFPREDPLKHRTFGALVTAVTVELPPGIRPTRVETPAVRVDEKTLRCEPGDGYSFEIAVHTTHPATPEKWLDETREIMETWAKTPLSEYYKKHVAWWTDFWHRSWIYITPAENSVEEAAKKPVNKTPNFYTAHAGPLRVGVDSDGGSRLSEIQSFTATGVLEEGEKFLNEKTAAAGGEIAGSENWEFPEGGVFSLTFRTPETFAAYHRLLDKITAGGEDGFLLDITPDGKLRFIVGRDMIFSEEKLEPAADYTVHFAFTAAGDVCVCLDETPVIRWSSALNMEEETLLLTRAYILQRYVDACAGRGKFLSPFNGSIFTVPHAGTPNFADYRRWGTGYWWQNMRLTRYAGFMAGDDDLVRPLLEMYHSMLPLCMHRTEKYFGFKNAAYFPECMYFWGDVFPESYGTVPWREREDKLQASGWHKWEWVSGLELACMMLAYYDYTGDEAFLREKAVPLAEAVTRFFDCYYPTDEQTGKLVMHPAQALETWWECTNPAPEVAGLHATLGRLLALPEHLTTNAQREAWRTLLRKIPDIPTWTDENGIKRLAPAEKFAQKNNLENPELYPVFPFRLVAFEKPLAKEAVNALDHRWDRGAFGWRQDDLFMAYLGLTDQACKNLILRARTKDTGSRFPVFWGPNYDWIPDQDHGGVLTAGLQSLIMQTDGRKIFLFPAFPQKWNVDFKLRAPYGTTVEGRLENGTVTALRVTPEERRKDVILCAPYNDADDER